MWLVRLLGHVASHATRPWRRHVFLLPLLLHSALLHIDFVLPRHNRSSASLTGYRHPSNCYHGFCSHITTGVSANMTCDHRTAPTNDACVKTCRVLIIIIISYTGDYAWTCLTLTLCRYCAAACVEMNNISTCPMPKLNNVALR
eukprot:scpid57756/ scgid29537/ 